MFINLLKILFLKDKWGRQTIHHCESKLFVSLNLFAAASTRISSHTSSQTMILGIFCTTLISGTPTRLISHKGMRHAKDKLVTNIISSAFNDNDTEPFWKFVRAKRCDSTGISPLKEGGRILSYSQFKADILIQQFTSVFTIEDTTTIPTPPGDIFPSFDA